MLTSLAERMANPPTRSQPLVDRFGLVLFAVVVTVGLLLLVELPTVTTQTTVGEIAVTLLTSVTLVLALLASANTRAVIWVGIAAAVVVVAWTVLSAFVDVASVGLLRSAWFALVVLTPFVVLRRLVQHRTVTVETLLGAASVYLLLAVMFMFLFLAIEAIEPGRFFGSPEPTTAFMYFSLVTITTLGYGDLAPASDAARAVAGATAVFGQVYLVFIVARMVGLYTASHVAALAAPLEPPHRIDRNRG